MENLTIYCQNPQAVISALANKVKTRKWKVTNIRLREDGGINCTCADIFVSTQVENFLDMIVSDEYQIQVN